jgi:hypothetical protein
MDNLYVTYNEYLEEKNTLGFEEAAKIYEELIESALRKNEDYEYLWNSVILKATKYAGIRAEWLSMSRENKIDTDSFRTSKHNVLIDAFNILARYSEENGGSTVWRTMLGDNRKRIGDFGCFIVYLRALSAR